MQKTVFSSSACQWIDITAPSSQELQNIAQTYQLHPLLVQDCLEPEHLPKFEKVENGIFFILRVFDPESSKDAATVQEITRKIAVFVQDNIFLTIHRAPLPFLDKMILETKPHLEKGVLASQNLLIDLCKRSVNTFDQPLEQAEIELERLEGHPTSKEPGTSHLLDLHTVRRRLSCQKRLLWHTSSVVQRISQMPGTPSLPYQDLKETVESFLFFSDELLEDATSLMNLELSIASQRTNEVVRVLTLFSVFFMPLTFIVGVYGMNFEHMPEFKWIWGYPFVWALIISVSLGIAIWFKKKGWLKF